MRNLKCVAVFVFSFFVNYSTFSQSARLATHSLYCMNHFAGHSNLISSSSNNGDKPIKPLEYKLIPRPKDNAIQVKSNLDLASIEVEIYNENKALIDRQKIKNHQDIDVSKLKPGMYVLHLISEKGNQQKLVFKT